MKSERAYIEKCIELIENQFQINLDQTGWKTRDMEYLIELIQEKSGIVLSLSTLKRLLRNKEQLPQPATLNALTSTIGFDSWQAFKISQSTSSHWYQNSRFRWSAAVSSIVLLLTVGWLISSGFGTKPNEVIVEGEVVFEANKTVATGVPNTVIFEYDVQHVKADSFFIQQSWNELERTSINPSNNYFSSIYYIPGFHRAKLLANDSILTRKFIHIKTDGWFALTRYGYEDPNPIYLDQHFEETAPLSISMETLQDKQVDTDQFFITSYFNVKDFGELHSDDFYLSTRLKVDEVRQDACPFVQVLLMAEEHIFRFPLIKKGCESNLLLKIGEVLQEGKTSDLSSFGTDIYQWQNLEVLTENKTTTISLNQTPIHEITFKEDFGEIVGVAISFSGKGTIQYFDLRSTNDMISLRPTLEEYLVVD